MIETFKTSLKTLYPADLVDALIDSYVEIKENYIINKWEPSELNGGKFVEAALRILQNQCTGNYDPIGTTIESNEIVREQILEIIKNQLRDNNPPETKSTYDRLRSQGFDDLQTRQMIGQCLAVELIGVLKFGKPYDNERYIKNLKALPKEPFD